MKIHVLYSALVLMVGVQTAHADSVSVWRIGGMIDANAQHTVEAAPASLFGLELAMIDVRYVTRNVRARVALHGGNYVDRNYARSTSVVPSMLHALHAAYGGVRLGDELWVDVGILPSHIGNETAVSSENITYTRSLIADSRPYFNTGARVSWGITPELNAAVLALNGWQVIYDMDGETAFGSLVTYTPTSSWKFGWSTFIGSAPVGPSQMATTRYFNDVYATFRSSNVVVSAAVDIGTQMLPANFGNFPSDSVDAVWYGASVQMKYTVDSVIAFNARAESFSDIHGAVRTGGRPTSENPIIPYNVVGGSVGLDITPRQYTMLRFEARMLHATRDLFSRPIEGAPSEWRPNLLWFTAALVVTVP